MKKLLLFIAVVSFIYACSSSQKALQKGNYEQAFMKSVKRLQHKPDDSEQAGIFTVSYQRANQANLDRIQYLKMSGEPNRWDEIYKLYRRLDSRQKMAETVLPLRAGGRTTNFKHVDYSRDLIETKKAAADYHYRKGLELLKGDKNSAKQAFYEFKAVKSYTASYSDINALMHEALEKGTTEVLLVPINKTYAQLSKEFLSNLVDFGLKELDKDWVRYYNTPQKQNFDYTIFISISKIYVGPDNMKEVKEIKKKKVEDGWKYVLDKNGNVSRDSLGNDIKVRKYKTISCTLIKKVQNKTSNIETKVEYQDNITKRIVASFPVMGNYAFNYVSMMANGDLNALDDQTRQRIGKGSIAFPSDIDMLNFSGEKLKQQIKDVLIQNKKIIK